ncbi:MAG: CPBP family intramembrane glutamic endopeptidase [Pirellulales bacterium]
MLRRWFDAFVLAPLRRAADEQRTHVAAADGTDWQVAVVLVTVAVMLTIQQYVFRSGNVALALDALGAVLDRSTHTKLVDLATAAENSQLAGLLFWAFGQFAVYVAGPVLVIKLLFRRPLVDYGVKLHGMFACAWAYLLMAAVMLPCVLYVSASERFLHTYPFYRLADGESPWPRMAIWEVCYAMQFVSLEFFFRGFLLHGTRRRFGAYSIYVMMVPYCMIHFAKPPLETLGAIAAGIVLGFMSLKTRSIWMGAGLHIFVAWTMDTAALWRTGRL